MQRGSIIMAMIWMAVISLLLFWLPLLGPLLAGIVGGNTAGGAGRGLLAAIIPGLVLCIVLAAAGTALTGIPVLGAIFGTSLFVMLLFQSLPLLAGALVGGLLA